MRTLLKEEEQQNNMKYILSNDLPNSMHEILYLSLSGKLLSCAGRFRPFENSSTNQTLIHNRVIKRLFVTNIFSNVKIYNYAEIFK